MSCVSDNEDSTVYQGSHLDLRSRAGNAHSISNPHYDDSYFAWQSSDGQFVANIERWKFTPFVRPGDVVLDFGCGGGCILAGLVCKERYGVEVNPAARSEATRLVKVHATIDDLPVDIAFDVIISHHALEHVDNPLCQLEHLKLRLKARGKMVFVVPSELWLKQRVYRPGDINQHLYTWTPLSLGNLFARAGLVVENVELVRHRILPKAATLYRWMPDSVFHFCCRAWAGVTWTRQIRIVASRPAEANS
jgi:SAM-dependent methyltransferase